jgi:hypothetical protein
MSGCLDDLQHLTFVIAPLAAGNPSHYSLARQRSPNEDPFFPVRGNAPPVMAQVIDP